MRQVRCNLCGSSYYSVVYDIPAEGRGEGKVLYKITRDKVPGMPLRLVRCLKCGLVYVNPQLESSEIMSMYQGMQDDVYLAEEAGRRKAARHILRKISRHKKGGRILEVGCATGFLLDEARSAGWEVSGVEVSSWASSWAKEKLNLPVFNGTLEDARFPDNHFDALIMVDVVEHLSDPKKVLQEARRVLKPDGVLCLSVPDIESAMSQLLRAKWWGIQHAHLYYFSRRTITQMLDAAGFKPVRFSSHARVFSVDYWGLRLKGYSPRLYALFLFLSKALFLKGALVTMNFKDQVDCVAQKKRCLAFLEQDERKPQPQGEGQGRKKVVVVLPAYNAARTLSRTVADIPRQMVDEIILVDDKSTDATREVAGSLGLKVFSHERNKGYGGNQKTCYDQALACGADIVVMVHPDYQYDPTAIPDMVRPIMEGQADAVFGSRMMKGGALEGGMPLWKHNVNILLSALENVVLGTYLSEYHSGFRAYSARYLRQVDYHANSDGFIFDNEIIIQGLLHYMRIEEVPIRTRYFEEASTIKMDKAILYGLGILKTLFKYWLHTRGIVRFKQFE